MPEAARHPADEPVTTQAKRPSHRRPRRHPADQDVDSRLHLRRCLQPQVQRRSTTPRRPHDDAGSAIPLCCAATTGPEHGGHHPQPVPRRVLDHDGHHVPGRVGVEMPVGVPHHPGHHGGVEDTELARETTRDTINRDALGIGGHHHRQRARPRRHRSITQPVHGHTHQPQARPHSDNHPPAPDHRRAPTPSTPDRTGHPNRARIRPPTGMSTRP